MEESGVIFQAKSRRKKLKKTLFTVSKGLLWGTMMVFLSVGLLPLVLGKIEKKNRLSDLSNNRVTFEDLLRVEADNQARVTEATYFSIQIPKIGAEARVLANVDSSNAKEYTKALKEGVAHAAGTYLPGMGGGITLFAHSTDWEINIDRYNAVFYRLDELTENDQVIVWFLGEKYNYRVTGLRVAEADDVAVFKAKRDGEKLYLVTCTPRGTTEKRLIVEGVLTD